MLNLWFWTVNFLQIHLVYNYLRSFWNKKIAITLFLLCNSYSKVWFDSHFHVILEGIGKYVGFKEIVCSDEI